ncbi:MAG: hypothetical protein GY803_23100 [Chloroflexi bacterium]|nr:hypothetical protein [Chloroflexota bacterium]
MRRIGKVVRVQVQVESLKRGERPYRTYSLTNLRTMPAIKLTKGGVTGLEDDVANLRGAELRDVHHMAHPRSRYRDGNGISFNFTSHYGRMRDRYGDHMTLGCAGENIVVKTDEDFALSQLEAGLVIVTGAGQKVRLEQTAVMLPCLPFSKFSLQNDNPSADALKETLQFLDQGMRGFMVVLGGETAVIRPGDTVYLVE